MLARPTLELHAQQRLCLTPQLRQALHVLRCSMPELERELARALAENPWLEPSDAPGDADRPAPEAQAPAPNLRDHLLEQLRLMRMPDRERALVMLLIDELDDNGYLAAPLEDIASSMPEGLQGAPGEWAGALARLQTLEPAGVGARTLGECLLLQIAGQDDAPAEVRACASLLAGEHLEELASNRLDKLARKLGCTRALLEQAHRLLLRLDPKPGRAWSGDTAHWIVPEILVRRQGEHWEAYLNPAALPRVRLRREPDWPAGAPAAADAHTRAQTDAPAPAGETQALAAPPLQEQWRQAQGLLRQLRQRYDTLLKVARQVVACQQDYFHHGPRAMRPLVLREVARTLGMHASTVSRATRYKYAQTPWGVFELRYFFAPAVASDTPQAVCATAVRALIREWVAGEAAARPLSDSRIAQRLADAGIPVARRTVAKYREAEGIPNAFRRKAHAWR